MNDLRVAFRQIRRHPAFTAIAVVTLSLGIGANTAIFSVLQSSLLRPLPFPHADRLVRVYEISGGSDASSARLNLSPHQWRDWQKSSTDIFSGIGVATGASLTLAANASEPARNIPAALVSANFFDVVGLSPVLGRNFLSAEDQPGAPRVAIIGYDFWQIQLAGRRDALGSAVNLDGLPYTVIGIMPKTYRHPYHAQVWLPLRIDYGAERSRHHYLYGAARLLPHLTLGQAQAATDRMCAALKAASHDPAGAGRTELIPLRDSFISDLRPKLIIIAAAALCALIVAAANFAGLLLSRAVERSGEMAMRAALGASRGRLVRQGLVQSLILTIAGTLCGLILAGWLTPLIVRFSPEGADNTGSAIREFDHAVRLDWPVFAFAALLMLIIGLGAGLFPAWRAARADLRGAINQIGRGSSLDGNTRRWLSGLIVLEIALASVLLVSSFALAGYFRAVVREPWGFATQHRLVFNAMFAERLYPNVALRSQAIDRTLEQLRALPGARAVTVTAPPPTDASWDTIPCLPEGSRPPEPSGVFYSYLRAAGPNYFATMGQKLLRGRDFTASDRPGGTLVCVVNQSFARRFWPEQDAIGKRIKEGRLDGPNPWLTIVGITNDTKAVADSRDGEMVGTIYLPLTQAITTGFDEMSFVVETAGPPLALANAVRAGLGRADNRLAAYNIGSLDDAAADTRVTERFLLLLVSLFGALGLFLSAIGVYGLLALQVARRTRELGIRAALGATSARLVRLVAQEGARLLFVGFAAGTVAAWFGVRILQHEWPGIPARDPWLWLGAATVLAFAVVCAAIFPARRAGRTDPVIALRAE